jgi:hypothetical protein
MAQHDHKMTQGQKRIKIAEACGWKFDLPSIPKNPASPFWTPPLRLRGHTTLPDYFNDLNACHEAEKTICGENFDTPLWVSFLCNLDRVVNKRRAHATAAQRAEAFGKTLNLW